VVFISMVASSIAEVAARIPFLLNRNRLNVAVSRASTAAVIALGDADRLPAPRQPAGLVELGAFLAMSEGERARREPGE